MAAIWREADALVMVRRGRGPAAGFWDLPGTAVDRGETAAEALVRAVDADTGAAVVCGPFNGWSELADPERASLTLYFEAVALDAGRDADAAQERRASRSSVEPSLEVRVVPLWEVSELRLREGLAEYLADIGLIDLLV